jgi:hypothetical protein
LVFDIVQQRRHVGTLDIDEGAAAEMRRNVLVDDALLLVGGAVLALEDDPLKPVLADDLDAIGCQRRRLDRRLAFLDALESRACLLARLVDRQFGSGRIGGPKPA